ncbi:hypothetical protein E2562_004522 [Oryza meyeriana var. granulata]|uniref:Uncharacterized protein n=1 Tax=Oryza meyeriana var. granulata TaxID=110450 RepID=A0A6G1F3D2_9ORYZ|nr:hypothetical protein E2562_004522 [Oryza meyeriana var. granulata]
MEWRTHLRVGGVEPARSSSSGNAGASGRRGGAGRGGGSGAAHAWGASARLRRRRPSGSAHPTPAFYFTPARRNQLRRHAT